MSHSSAATTPTDSSQHARAESEVSDVIMLDSEDTVGSPSSYTTASNTTYPASDHELPKSVANSRFFRLPREVRQHIYNLTLLTPWPILWPSLTNDAGLTPQLLCTNKKVYEEALPTLYQNTLNFIHPSDANMFLWNHNPETGNLQTPPQSFLV